MFLEIHTVDERTRRKPGPIENHEVKLVRERSLLDPGGVPVADAPVDEDHPLHPRDSSLTPRVVRAAVPVGYTNSIAWGAERRASCGDEFVFMDQAAKQVVSPDLINVWRRDRSDGWRGARVGRAQVKRSMRSHAVVATDVDAEDVPELTAADDQNPIEALAANASDPTLHEGVGVGRLHGSLDDLDVLVA